MVRLIFQTLGRVNYKIRSMTGGAMGAFFVYLSLFSAALFISLLLIQQFAFAPNSAPDIVASNALPAVTTVVPAGSLKPALPILSQWARTNGFEFGKVDKESNQAWVGLWSLWLTVPITLISAIFAIKIATRAEELSEGQTPEYEEAFAAAKAYGRFKSMSVILPSLLRQAQRDKIFDGNAALFLKVKKIVEDMQSELLHSSIPGLTSSIAGKTVAFKFSDEAAAAEAVESLQTRHADLLYAALENQGIEQLINGDANTGDKSYRNLMRWFHKVYLYIERIDSLLVNEAGALLPRSIRNPAEQVNAGVVVRHPDGGSPEGVFSPIEYWFIYQVQPISKLNRGRAVNDIHNYLDQAINKLSTQFSISSYSFMRMPGFEQDLRIGGKVSDEKYQCHLAMVVCLSDSSHFDISQGIYKSRDGLVTNFVDHVPEAEEIIGSEGGSFVFKFATRHDDAFTLTSRLLQKLPESFDRRRIVLFLDQVDTSKEYRILQKHFSFTDHIRFWQLCGLATSIIDEVKLYLVNIELPMAEHAKESLQYRIQSFASELSEMVGPANGNDMGYQEEYAQRMRVQAFIPGWLSDVYGDGMSWVKRETTNHQFIAAAQFLELTAYKPDGYVIDGMVKLLVSVLMLESAGIDAVIKAESKLGDPTSQMIQHLARRPLVERPAYEVRGVGDSLYLYSCGETIDINGIHLVATVYMNSDFVVQESPLVSLLKPHSADQGDDHARIYTMIG